jgi:hypothetical protein
MGLTILSLFLLLSGVVLAVQACTLYTRPDIGASFANAQIRHLFPVDRLDAAQVLWAAIIGAIFGLVLGVGLWTLQGWARWAILIATGVPLARGLVGAVVTLATSPGEFKKYYGDGFWFLMVIYGVIVIYMTRPDIRRAFTLAGNITTRMRTRVGLKRSWRLRR